MVKEKEKMKSLSHSPSFQQNSRSGMREWNVDNLEIKYKMPKMFWKESMKKEKGVFAKGTIVVAFEVFGF